MAAYAAVYMGYSFNDLDKRVKDAIFMGQFHSNSRTFVNISGDVIAQSNYKSGHTITSKDILTDVIPYVSTIEQADLAVTNFPEILKKYVEAEMTPIIGRAGSKAWELKVESKAVRNWLNPTDIFNPENNSDPSTGYLATIGKKDIATGTVTPIPASENILDFSGGFPPVSKTVINYNIDYYSGIVTFSEDYIVDTTTWVPVVTCYTYIGENLEIMNEDIKRIFTTTTKNFLSKVSVDVEGNPLWDGNEWIGGASGGDGGGTGISSVSFSIQDHPTISANAIDPTIHLLNSENIRLVSNADSNSISFEVIGDFADANHGLTHISGGSDEIPIATTLSSGLLSPEDKIKINKFPEDFAPFNRAMVIAEVGSGGASNNGSVYMTSSSSGNLLFKAGASIDLVANDTDKSITISVLGNTIQPASHASRHMAGGNDELPIQTLTGEISEAQHGELDFPTAHALATNTSHGFMASSDRILLDTASPTLPTISNKQSIMMRNTSGDSYIRRLYGDRVYSNISSVNPEEFPDIFNRELIFNGADLNKFKPINLLFKNTPVKALHDGGTYSYYSYNTSTNQWIKTSVGTLVDGYNIESYVPSKAYVHLMAQYIKDYTDDKIDGYRNVKKPVRVATIAPLNIAQPTGFIYNVPGTVNTQISLGSNALRSLISEALIIDNVSLQFGDRVLVKNLEGDFIQYNGIYKVLNAGSGSERWILIRDDDADATGKLIKGDIVFVTEGEINAGVGFVTTTTAATLNVGSSPITFVPFTGVLGITMGDAMRRRGRTINVRVSDNLLINGNNDIDLKGIGSEGSYAVVNVDNYGRVTGGRNLVYNDLPNIDASLITTGFIHINRLPVGDSNVHVARGNHTHSSYLTITGNDPATGSQQLMSGYFKLPSEMPSHDQHPASKAYVDQQVNLSDLSISTSPGLDFSNQTISLILNTSNIYVNPDNGAVDLTKKLPTHYGWKTKVYVDEFGRVTNYTDLSPTDIPTLDVSKINSGRFSSARLPLDVSYNGHTHNQYVLKTGDTLTGHLILNGDTPFLPNHAATVEYVTDQISANLTSNGGVIKADGSVAMVAPLTLQSSFPTDPWHATPKSFVENHVSEMIADFATESYVDTAISNNIPSNYLTTAGGTVDGRLLLSYDEVENGPLIYNQAINKRYLETYVASVLNVTPPVNPEFPLPPDPPTPEADPVDPPNVSYSGPSGTYTIPTGNDLFIGKVYANIGLRTGEVINNVSIVRNGDAAFAIGSVQNTGSVYNWDLNITPTSVEGTGGYSILIETTLNGTDFTVSRDFNNVITTTATAAPSILPYIRDDGSVPMQAPLRLSSTDIGLLEPYHAISKQHLSDKINDLMDIITGVPSSAYLMTDGTLPMTGNLHLANSTPTADLHAASKGFVDSEINKLETYYDTITSVNTKISNHTHDYYLLKSGGVMSGTLVLSQHPEASMHAATKFYVDDELNAHNHDDTYFPLAGGTINGDVVITDSNLNINNGQIFINRTDFSNQYEVVNKHYVDTVTSTPVSLNPGLMYDANDKLTLNLNALTLSVENSVLELKEILDPSQIGTWGRVTVDKYGRVVSTSLLTAADIPNLDTSKLTTGKMALARLPMNTNTPDEYTNTQVAYASHSHLDKDLISLNWNKLTNVPGLVYSDLNSTISSILTIDEIGLIRANGGISIEYEVTDLNHAVNKSYVDSSLNNLPLRHPVKYATDTELYATYDSTTKTLTSTSLYRLQVDNTTVDLGDRILVKDQTDESQNGVYVVTQVGVNDVEPWVLTRATDFSNMDTIPDGIIISSLNGTKNKDKTYLFNRDEGPLYNFIYLGGGADTFKPKNGFVVDSVTGEFSVGATLGRIQVTGNAVDIDPTWEGQDSIVKVGTITTGVWESTVIGDQFIAQELTGKRYNGVDITSGTGIITLQKENEVFVTFEGDGSEFTGKFKTPSTGMSCLVMPDTDGVYKTIATTDLAVGDGGIPGEGNPGLISAADIQKLHDMVAGSGSGFSTIKLTDGLTQMDLLSSTTSTVTMTAGSGISFDISASSNTFTIHSSGSTNTASSFPAGETLYGCDCVALIDGVLRLASSNMTTHADRIIGFVDADIDTEFAVGSLVPVITHGEFPHEFELTTFNLTDLIYLGNEEIVQTPPTSGFVCRVGLPTSSKKLFVKIGESKIL